MSQSAAYTVNTATRRITSSSPAFLFYPELADIVISLVDADGNADTDHNGDTLQLTAKDPRNLDADEFLIQASGAVSGSTLTLSGVGVNTSALETFLQYDPSRRVHLALINTTDNTTLLGDVSISVRHRGNTGEEDEPTPTGQAELTGTEINWATKWQYKTLTEDTTFTFAGNADLGHVSLFLTSDGGDYTPTFPANIVWIGGEVPGAISDGEYAVYSLVQVNSVIYAAPATHGVLI